MARVTENLLVKKARGNVGRQFVYKKRGKSTHIAVMPTIDKNAIATEKQEKVRDLFASASLYAQGSMTSPELKKQYQKKAKEGATAFNVAFRDYIKPPKVKNILTDKYTGNPASEIVIEGKDDFRVKEVVVSIHNAAGELVETGNAILNPMDRNQWIYAATVLNNALPGTKISAIARDFPGNKASLEVVL